jgi:hypothetical protein
MRRSTIITTVKSACANTGNATSTMKILAIIRPSPHPPAASRIAPTPDPSGLDHAHACAPHLHRSPRSGRPVHTWS